MENGSSTTVASEQTQSPGLAEKWLDDVATNSIVYFKRLAANDTLASGGHQAGPYVPKQILFDVFPNTASATELNPSVTLLAAIDSHYLSKKVRAVWYNNRKAGSAAETEKGTRNEARITCWGGKSSPLLNPENTGALAAFAFRRQAEGDAPNLRVWVCNSTEEEEYFENRVGPVEPSFGVIMGTIPGEHTRSVRTKKSTCRLRPEEIPAEWRERFPKAHEIVEMTRARRRAGRRPADALLLQRRTCEFEIFQSLEQEIEGPRIKDGFSSIEDFLVVAQTIIQRRKSRSGKSLELHLQGLFEEFGLVPGHHFSSQPESEPGKRPDFIFPSESAYKDSTFPAHRLRMLAVKTTCKDRWRQVINEAKRIPQKHLLTLQQGVSAGQHAEMTEAGVQLVVPKQLFRSYPKEVRASLMSLSDFIDEIKRLPAAV